MEGDDVLRASVQVLGVGPLSSTHANFRTIIALDTSSAEVVGKPQDSSSKGTFQRVVGSRNGKAPEALRWGNLLAQFSALYGRNAWKSCQGR